MKQFFWRYCIQNISTTVLTNTREIARFHEQMTNCWFRNDTAEHNRTEIRWKSTNNDQLSNKRATGSVGTKIYATRTNTWRLHSNLHEKTAHCFSTKEIDALHLSETRPQSWLKRFKTANKTELARSETQNKEPNETTKLEKSFFSHEYFRHHILLHIFEREGKDHQVHDISNLQYVHANLHTFPL